MAITIAWGPSTPHSATFYATHDGAPGNSVTIANATLLANMEEGPLKTLFEKTFANQAAARNTILTGVETAIEGDPACVGIDVLIQPRDSVATVPWSVDVDVDGSLLPRVIVGGISAGLSDCMYRLQYRYSASR